MRRFGLLVVILALLCSLCWADLPQHALAASALAFQQQGNQAVEQNKVQSGEHELPVWVRGVLEFVRVFVSWPALAALALIYFTFWKLAPYKLGKLLRPFRSLKLFGAEFVLSDEVGEDAEQAIVIYRKSVKRHFDMLVESYSVRTKLGSVIDKLQKTPRLKNANGVRWTIHVPDVLFADTLYQLVDYYPQGGGRARVFSFRFGAIGLCWRKKKPVVKGNVPKSNDPEGYEDLLKIWGMSEEEAKASGSGRQSFAAVPLRDESNTPVGIFYMDSNQPDAFASDEDGVEAQALEAAIIEECKKEGLTASLSKINDDFKNKRPAIRVPQ